MKNEFIYFVNELIFCVHWRLLYFNKCFQIISNYSEEKNIYDVDKVETLKHLDLTDEEIGMACSIINRFGNDQHPVAESTSYVGFTISYLKETMESEKFIKAKRNLSPLGKECVENIEKKIEDYEKK